MKSQPSPILNRYINSIVFQLPEFYGAQRVEISLGISIISVWFPPNPPFILVSPASLINQGAVEMYSAARNHSSFLRNIPVLAVIFCAAALAGAQSLNGVNITGNEGNEEIQGTIHFPSGHKSGMQPVVKLKGVSSAELKALASPDGKFTFTSLRPDSYTVTVEGGEEYENALETVAIGNSGAVPAQGNPWSYAHPLVYKVDIYLQPRRNSAAEAKAAATRAAMAKLPQPVQAHFNQANEAAAKGDSVKAIELLIATITEAPDFGLAYNELGVQYLKTGETSKAAEAFAKALALMPDEFQTRLNYGIALLNLKKTAAAEAELRRALKQNPASAAVHYYLGLALMNEKQYAAAESELKTSVTKSNDGIAPAHKYLGGIYWHNEQFTHAADELERYLKMEPKAPDADKLRGTIKELRAKKPA